jgi:DNA-binding beta-propeller fold protein YncE
VIDVATGLGGVWAVDVFRDRLLRIDPRTNRVVGQTRVPGMPSGVAVGHGRVWVVSQLAATLSAVDPSTGKVVAVGQFSYGGLWPGGLAVGAGGVWVITAAGDEVTLIDPSTLDIVRRVWIAGARTLATAGNALWVGLARGERVVRIDRGSIVRVPAPRSHGYGPPLAGGDALWLAAPGRIVALDARDGSVVRRIPIPAGHRVAGIAAAADLWITDEAAGTVLRLRPGVETGPVQPKG